MISPFSLKIKLDNGGLMFQITDLPIKTFLCEDCLIECFQIKKSRWVKIGKEHYESYKEIAQNDIKEAVVVAQVVNFFLKGSAFEVTIGEDKEPLFIEKTLIFYAAETLRGIHYKVHFDFGSHHLHPKYELLK